MVVGAGTAARGELKPGSGGSDAAEPDAKGPADLIIHHANVLTLDEKSRVFEAIAVKDGRIIGLGNDDSIFKLGGPKTRVISMHGCLDRVRTSSTSSTR